MQRLAECFAHNAHKNLNDMEVLAVFKRKNDKSIIDHLPIIPQEYAFTTPW